MDYKDTLKQIKDSIPASNQAAAREYLADCKKQGLDVGNAWAICLDMYGNPSANPAKSKTKKSDKASKDKADGISWRQNKATYDSNGNRLSRATGKPVQKTGAYNLKSIRQNVERVEDAETISVNEFYTDMQLFTEEYLQEYFDGDKPPKKEDKWIISLNEYLSNRIRKPRRSNPDEIYNCWTAYKKLLHTFGKSAHVLLFSYVCDIDNSTISSWAGLQTYSTHGSNYGYNLTPAHTGIAKKMIAESYSEHDYKMLLTDNNAVLDIFTSKALFGYVETAPVQTINHVSNIKTAAELPTIDDIMSTKNDNLIDVDMTEDAKKP